MGQRTDPPPVEQAQSAGATTTERDPVEQALNASGIGLWDWDLVSGKSGYSSLNQRLLGYDDAEDLGDTYDEQVARIHPDDLAGMKAKVDAHLRNETPFYRAEFRVRRRDGTYAWFESRGMVVDRGAHGEPLRMIGTHVDVTDRKAAEQQRSELLAALRRNQREVETLLQLQSTRLVDAAEKGNRSRSVFLSHIGDELHGPLETIDRLTSQLLADEPAEVPAAMRTPLTQIRRAGHRLADMVQQLLDLSRIETDSLEIFPVQFNLRQVLEKECEKIDASARAKGLDLRTVSCDETLVVFADQPRLAQVVRELLTNAVTYTTQGYIHVRARPFEGAVLVEVQDTGVGIAADRQPTLFQALQPVDGAVDSPRGRLGLGLGVCRAIVDAMGGTMGVSSRPGHGSRFWFTVPLALSAQRMSSTRH